MSDTHVTRIHNTTLCGLPIRWGEPPAIPLADAERWRDMHELGAHVGCLECCRIVRERRAA